MRSDPFKVVSPRIRGYRMKSHDDKKENPLMCIIIISPLIHPIQWKGDESGTFVYPIPE